MITLKRIYFILFLIGWFFFPFNDFNGIPSLGEFKNEAGAFFFMAGFVIFCVDIFLKGKLYLPLKSRIFQVLLFFLFWCLFTTVLNIDTVYFNYFKHTGGVFRFIRQYFALLLSALFFVIYFWNVIMNLKNFQILLKIRRMLLACLIFAFFYGFLETLIVVFNINVIRPLLDVLDYFPFLDVNYVPGERISSIAYESPSLGNYLITISGWMFSYILTEKSKYRFVPALMVLFLTFFSGSRTALIIITIQVCILISVLYSTKENREIVFDGFKYVFIFFSILLIINGNKILKAIDDKADSLNFSGNLKTNISNQSRFGMQYASLQVFKEHPLIGVGFGQETYFKRFHYPAWAKKNNYEFKLLYENKNIRSFPTAYNLYTRLLAETGLIGVLIFGYLIYLCISKSFFLWKKTENEEKTLALILFISFVGLSLNWLQTDFFRQYGFWLCMVILIKLLKLINDRTKTIIG